jgi:hypothetical protein
LGSIAILDELVVQMITAISCGGSALCGRRDPARALHAFRLRGSTSRVEHRKFPPDRHANTLGTVRGDDMRENQAAHQFYDETVPRGNPARQWFEEFYARVRQSTALLNELEKKTSQQFTKYVLQEAWGFWVDRVLDRAIRAVAKNEEQERRNHANWYRRVKRLLQERTDDPLTERMLDILESGTLTVFKAAYKRDRRGRPTNSELGTSEPTVLATKLTDRSRSETGKPHYTLLAKILHALFPDDFRLKSKGWSDLGRNLRLRIEDSQKCRTPENRKLIPIGPA